MRFFSLVIFTKGRKGIFNKEGGECGNDVYISQRGNELFDKISNLHFGNKLSQTEMKYEKFVNYSAKKGLFSNKIEKINKKVIFTYCKRPRNCVKYTHLYDDYHHTVIGRAVYSKNRMRGINYV